MGHYKGRDALKQRLKRRKKLEDNLAQKRAEYFATKAVAAPAPAAD